MSDMLKVPDENRPNKWIVPSLMMQKSLKNNVNARDISIVDVNTRISREVGDVHGTTNPNHISILSSFFNNA